MCDPGMLWLLASALLYAWYLILLWQKQSENWIHCEQFFCLMTMCVSEMLLVFTF